jgi:hypothetical protein
MQAVHPFQAPRQHGWTIGTTSLGFGSAWLCPKSNLHTLNNGHRSRLAPVNIDNFQTYGCRDILHTAHRSLFAAIVHHHYIEGPQEGAGESGKT